MKKLLRLVCLLLGLLTVLSSFAACAGGNGGDETAPPNDGPIEEDYGDDPDYISDLPSDLKFTGNTVSILGLDKVGVADELYVDPSSASANNVSAAVYTRNDAVETRLGITLDIYLDAMVEEEDKVATYLASNIADYDIIAYSTNYAIRDLVKGTFYDLTDIDNLDISKKYWTQGYNDVVSHGKADNQYLVTGAPALSLYRYTFVTIYNQEYFKSVSWEDLYDVVKRGDWTLEYQFQLVSDVYEERDGLDGITEKDFVGFVSGDIVSVDPYLVASNIHIVNKDSDGNWHWDNTTEAKVGELVDKIKDIYYESMGAYIYSTADYDNTGLTYIADKFAANEAAMATVQLHALEMTSGNMKFDYGIVPMPKFDKKQEDYYSYTQDQVTCFGIMRTIPEADLPMIGATLDTLAFQSYHKVVPEYYGVSLSYKFLQNAESLEMLHLVFDSVEFDFVGAFSAFLDPPVRDQMRTFVYSNEGAGGVSTYYGKWKKSMPTQIDIKFNNMFETFEK